MNRISMVRFIFFVLLSANSRKTLADKYIYFSLSAEPCVEYNALAVRDFADYRGIFTVFAVFHYLHSLVCLLTRNNCNQLALVAHVHNVQAEDF